MTRNPPVKPRLEVVDKFHAATPQCLKAPSNPEDRRRDKGRLKIVNFNAEWLFLYGGRGGIHCPTDACPWGNVVEALNHMQEVASLWRALMQTSCT